MGYQRFVIIALVRRLIIDDICIAFSPRGCAIGSECSRCLQQADRSEAKGNAMQGKVPGLLIVEVHIGSPSKKGKSEVTG